MSTKVKGDKIKESSIPLSAMDDNFKFRYSECPGEIHSNIQYIDITNFKVGDKFIINRTDVRFYVGKKSVQPNRIIYDEVYINSGYGTFDIPYTGPTLTASFIPDNNSIIMTIESGINVGSECILEIYDKYINKLDKKFLPDDIGGADWNAQQGEAGYIENKPFYVEYERVDFSQWSDEGDHIQLYDYYYGAYLYSLDIIGKYIKMVPGIDKTYDIGDVRVHITSNEYDFNIYSSDVESMSELIDIFNEYEIYIAYAKQINHVNIDDTVIKTTPQTLSTDDKNQALANLGIDPVVWKYLCNPCIIKEDEAAPNDLLGKNGDIDDKYVKCPGMFRKYNDSGVLECIYYDEGQNMLSTIAEYWYVDNGVWTRL